MGGHLLPLGVVSLLPLFLVLKCSGTPGVVIESVVVFLRVQSGKGP